MLIFCILLLVLCWFLFGGFSFIYWTTKEWDVTVDDIPIILFMGFCGPIAFLIGWIIYGEPLILVSDMEKLYKANTNKVLFKKRVK